MRNEKDTNQIATTFNKHEQKEDARNNGEL